MMEKIPGRYFEVVGTGFGLLASVSIASQVWYEYATAARSTLSLLYTASFLAIFLFWTLYGLRFNRPAMWVTNGLAAVMQFLLLALILMKARL